MAAVNTQFSIAVHLMSGLGYRQEGEGATSGYLAESINACPSFVRRVLSKLSKAGLVRTTTGKAGSCVLAKAPHKISLLDVYHAVQSPQVFSIHAYAEKKNCHVSCHIKTSLEKVLLRSQRALEQSLEQVSLADVISDIKKS